MLTALICFFCYIIQPEIVMSDAKIAIYHTIDIEGGYVNDPRDPGGETKYGISKRSFPNEDIKNLTPERAYEIYKENYWDKVKADYLPWPVNYLVFDFAVHSGPARAAKTLQKVLGIVQDGIVGAKTISAAHRTTEHHCAMFMTERMKFLASLGRPHYMNGWSNRLFKVAFRCGK